MTMPSLFFYNELLKLQANRHREGADISQSENDPEEREHYDDHGDWDDEDDRRE